MATWKGSPNFDSNRKPINKVCIHWFGGGSLSSANTRFQNPDSQVSAHYGISDKTVWQWVKEEDVAYHAGDYPTNQCSIGIEHDAVVGRDATIITYETSAKLIAEISERYNIPLDRDHIVPHKQFTATQCPGTLDLDKLIHLAKGFTIGGKLEHLEKELDEMRDSRNKWRNDYKQLKDDSDKALAEKQKHIESLQASQAEMNLQLTNITKQFKTVSDQLKQKEKDNKKLSDELVKCNESNVALRERLDEILRQLEEEKSKSKKKLTNYTRWELFKGLFRR